MGQEILYCFKCQVRITSADLDSSNALRFGTRTACRKCVPDLLAGLTDQERKDLVSRVQAPKKPATARFTVPATPRPKAYAVASDGRSNQVVLWSIGGVAAALVVGIVLLVTGGSSSPPPTRDPSPPPAPRGPEESSREKAAREAIARAKSLPSSDADAQLAAFEQAVRTAEGTSREREAKELRDEFIALRRKGYGRELGSVEDRARAVVQKEEFGAALAIFEAVRALHPGPEWNGLVDGKIQEVRTAADALYSPLKEQAAAARSKGAEAEVKSVRDRIARWGLPDKVADLDAHLKSLQASPPPKVDGWQWTPIFDGKSLDFLSMGGEGAWILDNGSLAHVKGRKASAQTKRHFSDGDFRIRFKVRKASHVAFALRQTGEGYLLVALDGAKLEQLDDREHEVFISCRGASVTATLDDKPHPVATEGKPTGKGPLQFNAYGEYFVLKTLEFREPFDSITPIAHWTFDNVVDGWVADVSGKGNPGTLENGPLSVPGRIGNALQFDGRRSHVAVASSPLLAITGPLTISAWVNPKPPDDSPMSRGVVEKWDSAATGISGYFLRISTRGHAYFMISEPGRTAEANTTKPLVPDTWTFVAGVYDGVNVKTYINGTLDRTTPAPFAPASSTGVLKIGMGGGGGSHYFFGVIDDVRIYNRALAADEVARLAGK